VISFRHDLDPSNLLEKIEVLDAEMRRLEQEMPADLSPPEKDEITDMVQANSELRDKVTEVSELVKLTLVKINVSVPLRISIS
jgi:hypothetical protein